MTMFLYFIAGIIQNLLFTLSIRFIDHDKAVFSALNSFLVSLIAWGALFTIFTKLDPSQGLQAIFLYALGVGIGTFIAMKIRLRYKGENITER